MIINALAHTKPRQLRGFIFVVDTLVFNDGEVSFSWGVCYNEMQKLEKSTLDISDPLLAKVGFDTNNPGPQDEDELAIELCGKIQFERIGENIRFFLPDGIGKGFIHWNEPEQKFL